MRKLRIPSEYIERERGANGGEVVRLTNPATNKDGLEIKIKPDGDASKLTVNTHGLSYSKVWRKLVNSCANPAKNLFTISRAKARQGVVAEKAECTSGT